ncbi:MAG: carboxylesterase family protein [Saprospiraceae bacterium]
MRFLTATTRLTAPRFFNLLLFALAPFALFAQANNGCDGERYRVDKFAVSTKTTLKYADTKRYDGSAMVVNMDVYEPGGDPATARPVVILAHGGSFLYGDKGQMSTYCQLLAKRGYVAATIQYRLYPFLELGFPDSLEIMDACYKAVSDMKAAVRFFREDAAGANQFKIDPNNIFIGGYSAGAVAALHAAYAGPDDVLPTFISNIITANGGFDGDSGNAANQSFSSDVKAVINMSGGLYRAHWVDADDVPLVSIHGTSDAVVPYQSGLAAGLAYLEGSGKLHPAAELAGIRHSLETVTGGDHVNMYNAGSPFAPNVAAFYNQATQTMHDIVCSVSGADDLLEAERAAWSVFPNPASGAFQIRLPEGIGAATVLVFNNLGQQTLRLENFQPGQLVPTAGLGRGIFHVQVLDATRPEVQFGTRAIVVE